MLGIDPVATHELQDDQGQFRVGYTAWVGILHSRYTSISRMGQGHTSDTCSPESVDDYGELPDDVMDVTCPRKKPELPHSKGEPR